MSDKYTVSRRRFLEALGAGTAFGFLGSMGALSYTPLRNRFLPDKPKGTTDIGEVKKLTITCISETSWFDNDILMNDMDDMGGLLVNQWTYPWPPEGKPNNPRGDLHPENAGGYAALLDIELLNGDHKFILLDTGWEHGWTDQRFKECGIDKMLKNNEIDCLFISHEHFDHFWGLPVTMKYKPDIDMYIGGDFYPEGKQFIKDSGFKGKLYEAKSKTRHLFEIKDKNGKTIPGVAGYYFPVAIICRVFGEQSIFVNVKDAGIVQVTGCCHQGILNFAEAAYTTLKGGDRPYGVYGGLHISPFEDWDPKYDDLVFGLGKYGFQKIGCNHCTGVLCARKFVEAGYPVVQGTARFRSKTTDFLGNGDVIEFP